MVYAFFQGLLRVLIISDENVLSRFLVKTARREIEKIIILNVEKNRDGDQPDDHKSAAESVKERGSVSVFSSDGLRFRFFGH